MSRPCQEWIASCVDAAEGSLEAPFKEHLRECPDCREALVELRSDLELLRPEAAPVPGPWLATSIRRKAEARRRRFPRRLVVLAPMVAAAGLLLFLSVFSGRFTSSYEMLDAGAATEEHASGPELVFEQESPESMEAAISAFAWEEDWGVGVETLLARADSEDLERLLESLPP